MPEDGIFNPTSQNIGGGVTGGVLGTASNRVFGARISATINFAGDIRQTNQIGAAISGVVSFAADISQAVGAQLGAVISGTISFAGDALQTNQLGTSVTGSIAFAGDVASASSSNAAPEYLIFF